MTQKDFAAKLELVSRGLSPQAVPPPEIAHGYSIRLFDREGLTFGMELCFLPTRSLDRSVVYRFMSDGPFAFPTTQWTAVVEAANSADLSRQRVAFEALCRDYWKPLYAFSRRMGHDQHEAEDLTQGFFAYLLQRSVLQAATPEMGRLRTYLLKIFQRYIGGVHDHDNAQKRGGGAPIFSLNIETGEELLSIDMAGAETPEMLYDRAWAQTLLRATLQELGAAETAAGRGHLFAVLKSQLHTEAEERESHAAAVASLGMTIESIRQAVSRLRKRFRDGLRDRIAATLRDPDDARIDEELHALKAALRSQA